MSKKEELSPEESGERAFEESVRRFAEAFFALTDEEKDELTAYVEGRCKEAEEAYKKRNGSK